MSKSVSVKKRSHRALGRGLSSLIPGDDVNEKTLKKEVSSINAADIVPNPYQPRKIFKDDEIDELSRSISSQGLLQPVLVRRSGKKYEIISGERRFRACRKLGYKEIECIVKERASDREMMEIALIENLQREDLNDIERAKGFKKLIDKFGLSHEKLSHRMGIGRSAVTNTLRLLKLPAEIQEMLQRGRLSMGHARAILGIEDKSKQLSTAKNVVSKGMSVREVEDSLKKKKSTVKKSDKLKKEKTDPDTSEVINRLQYHLGTPVNITSKKRDSGRIEISFFGNDDLNRIIDIILKDSK